MEQQQRKFSRKIFWITATIIVFIILEGCSLLSPTILKISPTKIVAGSEVTIYGYGFSFNNKIKFNDQAVFSQSSWNGMTLSFYVPDTLSFGPDCDSSKAACPMWVSSQSTIGTNKVLITNSFGNSSNAVNLTVIQENP